MKKKSSTRDTTASGHGAWNQMLKAVLFQNRAARVVEECRDGSIRLAVPTRSPPFLFPPFCWLIRPPKERITVLDPVGAFVWRACDGRQTVEQVVEKFAIKSHLSFHESRVSVTQYIKSLLQRGVLAVSVENV